MKIQSKCLYPYNARVFSFISELTIVAKFNDITVDVYLYNTKARFNREALIHSGRNNFLICLKVLLTFIL